MGEINKQTIQIKYLVAYDHNYPQIFFKHWEFFKELLELGAQQKGVNINFEEIGHENTQQET